MKRVIQSLTVMFIIGFMIIQAMKAIGNLPY